MPTDDQDGGLPDPQGSRGDDLRHEGPAEDDDLLADGADRQPDDGDEAGLPPEGDDPMEGPAPSG